MVTDIGFESTLYDEKLSDISAEDRSQTRINAGETTLHSKTFGTRRQTTNYLDDVEKNERVQAIREQRRLEKQWRETLTAKRIMRVYEVEEHMGSEFMEELSRLH